MNKKFLETLLINLKEIATSEITLNMCICGEEKNVEPLITDFSNAIDNIVDALGLGINFDEGQINLLKLSFTAYIFDVLSIETLLYMIENEFDLRKCAKEIFEIIKAGE